MFPARFIILTVMICGSRSPWAAKRGSWGIGRIKQFMIVDCRLQIGERGWQMADGRLQIADCRWQIADGKLQMANCRWQIADGKLQMANCKLIPTKMPPRWGWALARSPE